jgi:hypothetical protein
MAKPSRLTARQRRTLKMIKCRAYGHRWDDLGWLALVAGGIRLWSQQFHCDRCDMIRDDRYTFAVMNLEYRVYGKPDGYPGRLPAKEAKKILTGETEAQCWSMAEQSPFVTAA